MLKKLAAMLLVMLSLSLSPCPAALAVGGLQPYVDSSDGYAFLYPVGWAPVKVTSGPDIVFHDLIEQSENVSVVINPIPAGKTLEDLGTPGEVGYRLSKAAIAPPGSGRQAELVNAEARQIDAKTYYLLEYAVTLSNKQQRHNLASAVVSRGKLYTFNASTTEKRWSKIHSLLEQAVKSFQVNY
ncbi:hypothetical protein DO97_14855 [Neosynechococcus sphagnicola sy1]|uniref:PsbP C-terminal domain-containing protein n=1 Tax=Neosynechococcus sphagnicola sy1 TaxID=1497020 RepID=A0A098TI92_9CYAN|nr:photosystem II reaction center PsbP [Neosynechococcus sphagnicola]KGF71829.1 hypothetical protein DO97_14855 [Neosynechococcus sphagnicola sy1]